MIEQLGTNKNQKTSKTWNTVGYSVSNTQKPSTFPLRECNNCIWVLVVQHVAKISETSKVLKLKNSNLSSTSFSTPFLINQKNPEAIASSTSSLIWGLKEFTTVVESLTRPWSCFEATPGVQVSTPTVKSFWVSGVSSSWVFYGMQRCASNHPVHL